MTPLFRVDRLAAGIVDVSVPVEKIEAPLIVRSRMVLERFTRGRGLDAAAAVA